MSGQRPLATPAKPASPAELEKALARTYITDPRTATAAWLALELERPLLLEGPAGVGKTDLARALAETLERPLIRLQCYEGLDEAKALYEWDYGKQMLAAQLLRDADPSKRQEMAVANVETTFFSRRFLLARPLLAAIESPTPTLLLIDEVDRADPEFEAFLLEILSENQITIPEIGTIRAEHPPLVILTTNATRDMTDALRRRCLHAFLDYPEPSREIAIVELRVPGIAKELTSRLVAFVQAVRALELRKSPSISETIDWARALLALGGGALDDALVQSTLGALLKHEEDRAKVEPQVTKLLPK